MSEEANIRTLLQEILQERIHSNEAAVLLSGGVDSITCCIALQDIGVTPHAYTFRVDGFDTRDSRAAKKTADVLDIDITIIDAWTENLERDFCVLRDKYKCKKKTQFESTWPFLYVYPLIEETYVVSGVAADGHYGVSRKAMMHFKTPKERFDQFRHDYFAQENPAGLLQQYALANEHGKIFVPPYMDHRVYEYFVQFDWFDINRPAEKQLIMKHFKDAFMQIGRRRHENLQLVAGIDVFFEELLKTKLNFKNRTRVMDMCRDHAKLAEENDDTGSNI